VATPLLGCAAAASLTSCSAADDVSDPVVNPGEFGNLEHAKSVYIEEVEGLQAMLTNIIKSEGSTALMIQHNVNIGGEREGYAMAVVSESPSEGVNAHVQGHPQGSAMLQLVFRKPLSDSTTLNVIGLLQDGAITGVKSEVKYSGPDFTTTGFATLGQQFGGFGAGLQYFQTVSRNLSVGLDTTFITRDLVSIAGIKNTVYGAWQKGDYCFLGKYDQEKNEVTVRYCRNVSEKLKLAARFGYEIDSLQATWDVGYEMPVRLEEGGFPYTTLKTKLHHNWKLESSVEHALLQGQGIVSLHASVDHPNDTHKFGVGLKLQY